MGDSEVDYPLESLASLYDELADSNEEHPDVSLTHESEWCLSAFNSGLVIWENVAGEGEPQHLRNIPKEKVVTLWSMLASGNIDAVHKEEWAPGYGN